MFWSRKKEDADPALPPRTAPSVRRSVAEQPPVQQTQGAPIPLQRDLLPQLLINQGHVTVDEIRNALRKAAETGAFFGDILAEEGVLNETSLVNFLTKHCRIPHLSLLDYVIDKNVLPLIPPDVCWKYHLLPVDRLGRNLTVAMVNPLNQEALDAVRALCPDLRIKPILCSHRHFDIVAGRLLGENKDHDQTSWAGIPVIQSAATRAPVSGEPAKPSGADTAPDTVVLNSDRLLESVFQDAPVPADAEGRSAPASGTEHAAPASCTPEDVMYQYTGALVDSMFETYALLARKIPFFKNLGAEDVAKIFSQGNVVEYEADHRLFNKGDAGDYLYVILNGRVEVRDGYKRLAILHKGDLFGEMALASQEPRCAEAVTMARSSLLTLSLADIRDNMPPQVALHLLVNIITTLSKRLRQVNDT